MIESVIFDFDGVIVDSESKYVQALREIMREIGAMPSPEDLSGFAGFTTKETLTQLMKKYNATGDMRALVEKSDLRARELILEDPRPFDGVENCLRRLKSAGFKLAIASSSPVDNIVPVLERLEFRGYFEEIASVEEAGRGKPEPDVFLLAAGRLKSPSHKCLVVEDSVAGIRAAKRGGMYCVALTTTYPAEKLREADVVLDSLDCLDAVLIRELARLGHQ
ncbi:MAG: HAD family hydrolase [bacterium]